MPYPGEYEDGEPIRYGSFYHRLVRGSQIVPWEPAKKLSPFERAGWRQLLDSILDCYMIGKGRWQHFKCSDWHASADSLRIFDTACIRVVDWLNSDRFAFYIKHFKFMGGVQQARVMLCEALNGRLPKQIELLIEEMLGPNPTGKGGFTKEKKSNG